MNDHEDPEDDWRAAVAKPLQLTRFQPVSSEIELELAAASDCGKVQVFNTDHYLAIRLGRLQETLLTSLMANDLPPRFEEYGYAMLVADGFGEEGTGARASRIALSALAHLAIQYGKWNVRVEPETQPDIVAQGEFFYQKTNEAVLDASRADARLAGMATSLTAVYIAATDLFFAQVGHSRAFLFRDGILVRLTTDHTLERQLQESPRPHALARWKLDQKHVVTETVGGRPSGPNVDIEHIRLLSNDRVLLCTNGLTDVVSEDQIADVLALQRQPKDDCHRLVGLALAAGGPDNVTVLEASYHLRSARSRTETESSESEQ